MPLSLKAKTYQCEYADIEASDDGNVVVTLFGNFPAPEKMTVEETTAIVNDPQFLELLRLAYQHAMPGTPLRCAFDRMKCHGGMAVLRFQKTEIEVAA